MLDKELKELRMMLEKLDVLNKSKERISLNEEELICIKNDIYKNIQGKLQACNKYIDVMMKGINLNSINNEMEIKLTKYMNDIDLSKKNLGQKTFKLDKKINGKFEKFCKNKSGYTQQALVSIALKFFMDEMEGKNND